MNAWLTCTRQTAAPPTHFSIPLAAVVERQLMYLLRFCACLLREEKESDHSRNVHSYTKVTAVLSEYAWAGQFQLEYYAIYIYIERQQRMQTEYHNYGARAQVYDPLLRATESRATKLMAAVRNVTPNFASERKTNLLCLSPAGGVHLLSLSPFRARFRPIFGASQTQTQSRAIISDVAVLTGWMALPSREG